MHVEESESDMVAILDYDVLRRVETAIFSSGCLPREFVTAKWENDVKLSQGRKVIMIHEPHLHSKFKHLQRRRNKIHFAHAANT
jgi:hypothetical protein